MKIAVTYENGQVFQHFGHTAQFKLYDVENGAVVSSQVVDTNGSGHGALAGFLQDAPGGRPDLRRHRRRGPDGPGGGGHPAVRRLSRAMRTSGWRSCWRARWSARTAPPATTTTASITIAATTAAAITKRATPADTAETGPGGQFALPAFCPAGFGNRGSAFRIGWEQRMLTSRRKG